jgi:phosphoglycerate kinase
MQQEITNLNRVINPERPFVAVVAGSKYDTKIGPLYAIYDKVDSLILGGVIFNTYLCAKYGISIKGVRKSDVEKAKDLVNKDRDNHKIVELPYIIESDTLEGKFDGKYRTLSVRNLKRGDQLGYVVDVDTESMTDRKILEVIHSAKTIFVNAVMGFIPHFTDGSMSLDETIDKNTSALKMYGGGDTLQEFKNLCPGLYLSVIDNTRYYFFTGGGTVLKAIEQGSPYGLKPVLALMRNKESTSEREAHGESL